MQGFFNLANDLGVAIAWLIPLICYLVGGGLLIASIHGFWQILKPGSESNRRPTWPAVTLFISATLLSFDRMLDAANTTFGGNTRAALTRTLTTYQAPATNAALLGNTPEEWLLNVIYAFEHFFQAYGALIVLLGVMSFHHIMKGNQHHHRTYSKAVIQVVFGLAVMNVRTIAQGVIGYFA